MAKLKPLLPSLREKKRYVVFEVLPENKVSFEEVKRTLENRIQEFLGVLETSKAGIIIMDKWDKNKGILRVSHNMLDKVKAAIVLIKEVNGKRVIIKTVGVSGILKKAQNKFYT